MAKIAKVIGREILDSRGNPTVEADILLDTGTLGRAAVPSGASTGELEALELRDGDASRYQGKGTRKAIANIVNEIGPAVTGYDPENQEAIDELLINLDGTPSKERLGANAILAVSMATARAAAECRHEPLYRYLGGSEASLLPVPFMNILNGGVHASSSVDFQEFLIAPIGAPSFAEALRMGVEVFHTLKRILQGKGYSTAVGDEGGFAPSLKSNEEAVELILEAIVKSRFKPGLDISIAIDPAASEFFDKSHQRYVFEKSDRSSHLSSEMVKLWANWIRQYPIISLEDGMAETDWNGWTLLTEELGQKRSAHRRRYFCDEPGHSCAGNRSRYCECDLNQAQSDWNGHGDAGAPCKWLKRPGTRGLSLTVLEKQKIRLSRIFALLQARAKLRRARPAAPIAWQSTTSSCELRSNWAQEPNSRVRSRFPERFKKSLEHSVD